MNVIHKINIYCMGSSSSSGSSGGNWKSLLYLDDADNPAKGSHAFTHY